MLKVHVWLPHGDMVGHASLSFGLSYVSFWPADGVGKKDLKIKRSTPGHFMNRLADDIFAEGGRQPVTVAIPRVDAEKLERFIVRLQENMPEYQIARYNCSHVVAECLKVVCNKDASFSPSAHDYSRLGRILGNGIWTPFEILRYAKELAKQQELVDENHL